MRCGEEKAMPPPSDGSAAIALNLLRGRRFFYNEVDSMSGVLALASDLEGMGETLDIFSHREQCGSHRRSIKAVAEGAEDLAAIHFKSFYAHTARIRRWPESLVFTGLFIYKGERAVT